MLQTLTIRLRTLEEKLRLEKMGEKLLDLVGEKKELREGALSKSNKRKEPPFLSDMSTVFENYTKVSFYNIASEASYAHFTTKIFLFLSRGNLH